MSHANRVSDGFTLVEVAFSIAIIGIGILTMALFIPIALRSQQQARYQMYAGTMAMELIERFISTQTANTYHPEANAPWDTPSGYRVMSPDLEIKSATMNAGFIPVPRDIAYRIDSPNDEIRNLLDQGGNIYYANPRIVAVGARDGTTAKPLAPVDSQRLIIGVVGAAQQNALPNLPQKAWPYRVPYPSQPHGFACSWGNGWDTKYAQVAEQWMAQDPDMYFLMVHDFRNVAGTIDWDGTGETGSAEIPSGSGYLPTSGYADLLKSNYNPPTPWENANRPVGKTGGDVPGWVTAKGYVALAVWYAQRKNLPVSFLRGNPTQEEVDTASRSPAQVYALRFLAHAGMCLTKHYSLEARPRLDAAANIPGYQPGSANPYNAQPNLSVTLRKIPSHPGLRLGIPIPGDDRWDPTVPASVNDLDMVPGRIGVPSPFTLQMLWDLNPALPNRVVDSSLLTAGQFVVTHDMVVNWAESCLKAAMQHATINPYDWSAPRPMNRPLFTDYPLLQWDLFPTAAKPVQSGTIYGTNGDPNIPTSDPATPGYLFASGVVATQWRPVAGSTIVNNLPGAAGTIGGNADNGLQNRNFPRPVATPVDWNAMEGTPAQFNLTNRFSAAERCREIVVWTADWMSYVDVETAPSAPVDASRYPRQRPASGNRLDAGWWRERNFTKSFMGPTLIWGSPADVGGDDGLALPFSDIAQTSFRNPELALLFIKNMNYPDGTSAVPTFHDVFPWTVGPALGHDHGANTEGISGFKAQFNPTMSLNMNEIPADFGYAPVTVGNYRDQGEWGSQWRGQDPRPNTPVCNPRAVFSGLYGADRNINNVLDRGPVPRSARIRANQVARYLYYDPRLITSLR